MNTVKLTPHLSDEQIDAALIGDLASSCSAHLAACDECRNRLEEAGAPLASFNAVSLAWSERRSATMPLRPVTSVQAVWPARAAWAATAAVALAVGITVPVLHHSADAKNIAARQEAASSTLLASTGPVDNPVAARAERIARDNQMLQNIDRELDSQADSPYREYGLQTASTPDPSAHAASLAVRN